MLSKTFGLGIVLFLASKSTSMGEEQFSFFVNFTKNIAVNVEAQGIGKVIYLDYVIGNDCNIPDNSRDTWAGYIRSNMTSNDKSRDTAQDHWETYYQVNLISNDLGKDGFEVRSAGADEEYETNDDIVSDKYCK
jgi:hypothetical protein